MILQKTFNQLQLLRFDVSIGAVILTLFLSSLMGVTTNVYELSALGLSVILIYNLDHLVDIRSRKDQKISDRRNTHYKNRKILLFVVLLSALLLTITLMFLNRMLLISGTALGFLVILYFYSVNEKPVQKAYHKEIFAGLLYSLGLFIIPFSHTFPVLSETMILLFVEVFLIATSNLLIYSLYDQKEDIVDDQPSLAVSLGAEKVKRLIKLLFFLALSLIVYVLYVSGSKEILVGQIIFLLMISCTWLLFVFKSYLEKKNRFRLVGDTVFFLPLLYFLI